MPGRHILVLVAATALTACSYKTIDAVVATDAGVLPPAAPSCAAILRAFPQSPSGTYTVDPDGPGGHAPIEVLCDMVEKGGGWTRLASEDFSQPVTGFSNNTITECGAFGRILGGYKTFGKTAVTAVFDLKGVPHTELRLRFEYVVIDSWDGEIAYAELDGKRFWQIRCDKGNAKTCGQTADQCGWDGPIAGRNDGAVPVDALVPHSRDEASVLWGAMLDQSSGDESWGIDNVGVFVR